MIGEKYGKLTVLKKTKNKHNKTAYLCKCECGNEKVVYKNVLLSGQKVSCGCNRSRTVDEIGSNAIKEVSEKTIDKCKCYNFKRLPKKSPLRIHIESVIAKKYVPTPNIDWNNTI